MWFMVSITVMKWHNFLLYIKKVYFRNFKPSLQGFDVIPTYTKSAITFDETLTVKPPRFWVALALALLSPEWLSAGPSMVCCDVRYQGLWGGASVDWNSTCIPWVL